MFSRLFALCLVFAAGCRPAPPEVAAAGLFEDVTAASGLDFTHDPGPISVPRFMPQIFGSGAALLDLDGDGLLDILLLQGGGPGGARHRLFQQQSDGTFRDVSENSGLDFASFGTGVAVGDIDGDGYPDVAVGSYGGIRLFRNLGNLRFSEMPLPGGLRPGEWVTSSAFTDFDGDGRLDLVVVCYLAYDPLRNCLGRTSAPDYCHPDQFAGSTTRLFRNLGGDAHSVRFEDVTVKAGLDRRQGPGLGIACGDFAGNGRTDLLVANDGKPNHLWVNRGDGTFAEDALPRGLAHNGKGVAEANMGIAVGDADGDGREDVFITHLDEETHTLWKQTSPGYFSDATVASGLAAPKRRGTGFGAALADFDGDGVLDLAVVNGRIAAGQEADAARLGPHWSRYAQRAQLFLGTGGGTFVDASDSEPALCGIAEVGRSLVVGDIDNDGRPDLLVTSVGGRARLLKNVSPRKCHRLSVRVVTGKRDAHGAIVRLRTGGQTRVATSRPEAGYQSSGDPRVGFSFAGAEYDGVEVRWGDGSVERFPGGPADRMLELRQGTGTPVIAGKKR